METGILFLGMVPLDPRTSMPCTYSEPFVATYPTTPNSAALQSTIQRLQELLLIHAPSWSSCTRNKKRGGSVCGTRIQKHCVEIIGLSIYMERFAYHINR